MAQTVTENSLDRKLSGSQVRWPTPAVDSSELRALYDIAQTMGTNLGVSETLSAVAPKLTQLVPFCSVALFLFDDSREHLRCRIALGEETDQIKEIMLPIDQDLAAWIKRSDQPAVAGYLNIYLSPRLTATTSMQSTLIGALMADDQFIGILSLYHNAPGFYQDDHRRILKPVSERLGTVIRNAILFEQTQADSCIDPITELPNSRYLSLQLTRELSRADRFQSELSLMVLELDTFTEINEYGLSAAGGRRLGHEALATLAQIIRTAIRPYDVVVRYDGATFVVLKAGCGIDEADQNRLELQRSIGAARFEACTAIPIGLQVSIGIAVFPHDGASGEELLAVADRRRYQAKADRRHSPTIDGDSLVH